MSPPGADRELAAPALRRPRSRAWWLVLTARVVLLAIAAAASAFALLGTGRAPPLAAVRYRCPMHAGAVAAGPADCPICGMALVLDEAPVVAATPTADLPPARLARATRRTLAEQVRAPAWTDANGAVGALVFREDLVDVAPGEPAQFFSASAPSVGIDVTLGAEPPRAWDDATVRVGFQVVRGAAPPGEPGSLVIAARPRSLVVVPTSAVLQTPSGPCVIAIDPATRREVRREVQLGREHLGVTAVLSGVTEGEEIVVGDAFFVAAEHRLHEAAP